MKCFTCGSNDIHELIEVISQKFKDVNIEATCISNVCDKCGVSFTNDNELREWEMKIVNELIKRDSLTEEMKTFIRKAHGMSKKVFEKLIQ